MSKQHFTGDTLKASERLRHEGGFSLLQMVMTVAVIMITGAFAVMSITSARENLKMTNSARQFAGYIEKARIDAVRRHVSSATPTTITFVDSDTYRVTMDFDGDGVTTSQNFTFQDGVTLFSEAPAPITFDWRGRMTTCNSTFALQNSKGNQTTVDVTSSGDVTVDSDVENAPTFTNYTNVNRTVDVSTDAVVRGTTAPPAFAATDCSAVSVGPAGGAIGGGGGAAGGGGPAAPTCSLIANPGALSIRKDGVTTGVVNISVATTTTVSVSGASNLQFTPVSQTVTSNGTTAFSIKSRNSTRGTFRVTFSSACTTTDVMVTITN